MKPFSHLLAVGILLISVCAFAREDSTKIDLAAVPGAAQPTINAEIERAHGTFDEVDRVVDDGKVTYDVDFTEGKHDRSFSVDAQGRLLNWQVFMNEVPVPVKNTIQHHLGKPPHRLKVDEIDRVFEDKKISYEVQLKHGTNEYSWTIAEDGKMLTREMALDETPAPVKATIEKQIADGKLKSVELNTEDDEPTYDVEYERAGKSTEFSVTPAGQLAEDN